MAASAGPENAYSCKRLEDYSEADDFVRLTYLPSVGVLNTEQFEGALSLRLKEKAARSNEKAIEVQLTKRFSLRVFSWPESVVKIFLELNMAKRVRAGEIKGGDSVVVDLDSDGKLVILGGSSAAPAEQVEEPVVG